MRSFTYITTQHTTTTITTRVGLRINWNRWCCCPEMAYFLLGIQDRPRGPTPL